MQEYFFLHCGINTFSTRVKDLDTSSTTGSGIQIPSRVYTHLYYACVTVVRSHECVFVSLCLMTYSKSAVLLALTRVCCRSVWVWGSGLPADTWCAGCPDCCRWSDPPPPQSDLRFCSCWRPSWCLCSTDMTDDRWFSQKTEAGMKRVELTLKCLWSY